MFLNTEIVVRYEYAEVVEGAPSRLGHPAITYPLPADSLLRVKFNSRDSWPTGEWHYHQTLFSVLRTERPSTTMFLSTPKKTILDLEDLW